jgi:acetyl-CoA carboxylase carboxyltransferase component
MAESPSDTGWEDVLAGLDRRRWLATHRDDDEAVQRYRAQGRWLARERVERLLDDGSFREVGSLAGSPVREDGELVGFRPAGTVVGSGTVGGRRVMVSAGDFTARPPAGSEAATAGRQKATFAERYAQQWRLPLVRLIDAYGADIRYEERLGHTYVPRIGHIAALAETMKEVPVVSAVMGAVAGGPAAEAMCSHWTIMLKGQSQIFPAGPPVVRRALGIDISKEELGGYTVHAMKSGVIDNVAEDEADLQDQIRRFLSYLPSHVWELAPRGVADDDPDRREEELLRIIPRRRGRVYDVRKVLRLLADRDSVFELSPFFGRSLVTVFARFNGYPVGMLANDGRQFGGAMDATASEKLVRFVDLCDQFHLPLVNLVDQPGFMIGPAAEEAGTIRKGTRALFAVQQTRVPWMAIIIRKSYGVAGGILTRYGGAELVYGWPSAEWGSIPAEGGVLAAYRREIESAPDPEKRRQELEDRLTALRAPYGNAEAFGVVEMLDPRTTRRVICDYAEEAQALLASQLGPKVTVGIRP